jgi:hypothetical protein
MSSGRLRETAHDQRLVVMRVADRRGASGGVFMQTKLKLRDHERDRPLEVSECRILGTKLFLLLDPHERDTQREV